MNFNKLGWLLPILMIGTGLVVSSAFAKDKVFTGEVGDTLCGLEHSMSGSALECVRECRGKGSSYSLIIGDKVYALETDDEAILSTLDKLATMRAKVTGTEKGNTIIVTSVKAVK